MGEMLLIKADYIQGRATEVDSRPLNCNIMTKNSICKMLRENSCQSTILYPHISYCIPTSFKIGSNANTSFQTKNEKAYGSHTFAKEPSWNVLQRKKLNPDKGDM